MRLRNLFVEEHHVIVFRKPDGFAVPTFDQVLGVPVGVHVDLDAGGAVANRAIHLVLLLVIILSYYIVNFGECVCKRLFYVKVQ